jgi:hypothetical protein
VRSPAKPSRKVRLCTTFSCSDSNVLYWLYWPASSTRLGGCAAYPPAQSPKRSEGFAPSTPAGSGRTRVHLSHRRPPSKSGSRPFVTRTVAWGSCDPRSRQHGSYRTCCGPSVALDCRSPRRSRRGQCDGERITAQDHGDRRHAQGDGPN